MSKTVSIVDDDRLIAEAIQIMLQEAGYNTTYSETKKELLTMLEAKTPGLIFMDILLAEESGLEIAKALRNEKKYQNIPIVLMSANSTDIEDIHAAGAQDFLKKPFNMKDLIDLANEYYNCP